MEVTSTVPASATVTLAAVQAGLLLIDWREVASLSNCLNRCWFRFLIKRLFDLRLWCLLREYTGLFISPSGISELDCATTKTDTAERSISIGRESLRVIFVLEALAYFQVPPLGGSREEKWRSH